VPDLTLWHSPQQAVWTGRTLVYRDLSGKEVRCTTVTQGPEHGQGWTDLVVVGQAEGYGAFVREDWHDEEKREHERLWRLRG